VHHVTIAMVWSKAHESFVFFKEFFVLILASNLTYPLVFGEGENESETKVETRLRYEKFSPESGWEYIYTVTYSVPVKMDRKSASDVVRQDPNSIRTY
jgi:hypothetical protein